MGEVLFFVAGIGAVAGAIGVVAVRNPFYSVLALVSHLLCLAALFLLLRAEFVAAAQVVVYAGAVMVLYVFVVAYIGGQDEPLGPRAGSGLKLASAVFGGLLFVELCVATLGSGLKLIDSPRRGRASRASARPPRSATLLLTKFLSPSRSPPSCCSSRPSARSCSRAAAAASAPPRSRRSYSAMDILRPAYTGTMAEGVGGPHALPKPAASRIDAAPAPPSRGRAPTRRRPPPRRPRTRR